jgi:hypothetical protein
MEISLHTVRNVNWQLNRMRPTYSGCRALIPVFEAMAPVIKGNSALPAWPKPAIHPIDPDKSHRGTIRPAWFMTMGYMGPRTTPIKETETAPPMRDGTNHTTSSRLG